MEDDESIGDGSPSDDGNESASATPISVGSAGVETGTDREATISPNFIAKLPKIAARVIDRVEEGDSVRESINADFRDVVGSELTDLGVKDILKSIALVGAHFKISRGPSWRNGIIGSWPTKHHLSFPKPKPKQKWTAYAAEAISSTAKKTKSTYVAQLVQIVIESFQKSEEMDIDTN